MFLSIIIPVYNAEKYLEQCLDSCLSQNFPVDDYEIICVNDGSTDRSEDILIDYTSRFPNLSFITKVNEGCSVARNVGMDAAHGDYLWFVDNDDLLAPNTLGMFKDVVDGRTHVRGGDCYEFPYCSFCSSDIQLDGSIHYPHNFIQRGPMIGNALWPQIFRRKFIIEHGLYHRGKRVDVPFYGFGMDALFLYECKRSGMITHFISCDHPLYFYRRSENSITTDLSPNAYRARVYEYLDIIPLLQDYYQKERQINGTATSYTADTLMDYVRTLLTFVAQSPADLYAEFRQLVSAHGYIPFTQPPESTYCCPPKSDKAAFLRYSIITCKGLDQARKSFLCQKSKCVRFISKLRILLRKFL